MQIDTQVAPQTETTTAPVEGSSTPHQETTGTPAPGDPAGAPKERVSASAQFEALAKRERATQRRIQEAKSYESQLRRREEAIKSQEERYRKVQGAYEQAQQDPEVALKELGWDYNKITEWMLNNKKMTPELRADAVEQKLASFVKQQEERERQQMERAKHEAEQQVQEEMTAWRQSVGQFVTSHPDDYEMINLYEAQDLVTDLIEDQWAKNKEIITNQRAAELVEEYLLNQVNQATQKKKYQSKYAPKPPEEKKEQGGQDFRESKTLHNEISSGVPNNLSATTEYERTQRALAELDKYA